MSTHNISPFDTALVVGTALSTVLIGECISWALIYRKSFYQTLVQKHAQLSGRQRFLSKLIDNDYQGKSCPEKFEFKQNADALRHIKKDLFKARMTSSFIVGICMLFLMRILFWFYQGVTVAVLPFKPIGLIKNLTHSDLQGDDYSMCSVAFLYLLTLFSMRNSVRKLIGFKRPRTREPMTISFPARLLFPKNGKEDSWWQSPRMVFLVMAGFYGYSLYKLMRKHNSIKHKIAFSRNVSRFTGVICSLKIPVSLRPLIYGGFGKVYGVNFEEMKHSDLRFYETFNKFFTRELKEGARKIEQPFDKTTITSPCDGRVLSFGEIDTADSTIDCVKGRSYRLDEFMLGVRDDNEKTIPALIKKVLDRGNKLFYMVIYLAPSDYHRFHSAAICNAEYRRHIAGYLDPVKPAYVNKHKDVFKNNERVNLFGDWHHGFFLTSFVGALNVGSIKLTFDPKLNTNQSNPKEPYLYDLAYGTGPNLTGPLDKYMAKDYKPTKINLERKVTDPQTFDDQGISFAKGETLGWFEMGSTVVLIFEGPQETQLHITEGQKLKLGQEIVTTVQSEQAAKIKE